MTDKTFGGNLKLSPSNKRERDAGTEDLLNQIRSEKFPYRVTVEGKEFIVFPGVYSPKYTDGTAIFAKNFPYRPNEIVLEIGSGTGTISLLVAYNGARKVVAIDINPDAVKNTQANISLHNMTEKVEVREGNLYEPLLPDEKFDTIFWNVPYCLTADTSLSELEHAVYDPGYRSIEKFIKEARMHLKPGGRLLIGFSTTLGRLDLLEKFAKEANMSLEIISETGGTKENPIKTQILEAKVR